MSATTAWTDIDAPRRAGLTRLTTFLLALTVFSGGFVFKEPSPYELVFTFLFGAVLLGTRRFATLLSVPMFLFALWLAGGALSLAANNSDIKTITYLAISAYLALSAIVFAILCAERPEKTAGTIRRAYIAAALITALAGIAGSLHLFPGADMFASYGRARGMFKDPNVFSPFLILPALLLFQDIIVSPKRRLIPSGAMLAVLATGILLSFSRASWGHFLLSGTLMAGLMFVTSGLNTVRIRIVGNALLGLCLTGALIAVLMTIPSLAEIFIARADLVQDYDAGVMGRFGAQLRSLTILLDTPLGFGPYGFAERFGQDSHNVLFEWFFILWLAWWPCLYRACRLDLADRNALHIHRHAMAKFPDCRLRDLCRRIARRYCDRYRPLATLFPADGNRVGSVRRRAGLSRTQFLPKVITPKAVIYAPGYRRRASMSASRSAWQGASWLHPLPG